MKERFVSPFGLLAMFALLVSAPLVWAQDNEDIVRESQENMEAWVVATNEFVEDVRFEEKDIQNLIRHWESFNALEEASEVDEDEEVVDFAAILSDPEYRKWASSNGLDAEDWLQKFARILALVMREQMLAAMAQSEAMMPEQMKMIEAQKDNVGEEAYRQMKDGYATSMAIIKASKAIYEKLPEGTAKEKELLTKYRGQITSLMMAEEEDEEDEYGEYDEYYSDDEYEEEYGEEDE
jgi:hypothetical protein